MWSSTYIAKIYTLIFSANKNVHTKNTTAQGCYVSNTDQ